MILSHCVRVNHDLFTEWIISQLHTEWCCAWRDENSALHWHNCSVIAHWKSCYLQTLHRVADSCCLCCSLSLSGSPAIFLHAPVGVCLFFWLQNIIFYYSLCAADKKMCFSPGKVNLRMRGFDCSCTSGIGDTEAEYWERNDIAFFSLFGKGTLCCLNTLTMLSCNGRS